LSQSRGSEPVWRIAEDDSTATISEQFTEHASDYDGRYASSGHFESLFKQSIDALNLVFPDSPYVLDLGSGSGANSVVPFSKISSMARFVATDLSSELLSILASNLRKLSLHENVICVVMDSMSSHISEEKFDVVTGSAILHHLTNPNLGIRAAARALKPGGVAMFFEPFDGYSLMSLAYKTILSRAGRIHNRLDPLVEGAMRGMIADISARTNPDEESPLFEGLDDKWLFSQEKIEKVALESGFSRVSFVTHNFHKTLFRDVAQIQMRLATGVNGIQIPEWALSILDMFDETLPPEIKRRAIFEGTIILTK
jgi:ubiquinone/menaquinone biosynthesis C-methylase UbiE